MGNISDTARNRTHNLSGVVRGGRGGEMPQAALGQKAAFSVKKTTIKGGIFGSKRNPKRRHLRFEEATIKGGIFGSKRNPKT